MPSEPPTTADLHDALDYLLWGFLVHHVPAWRLRGVLEDYVAVMEYFEHRPEIVDDIRRKKRWERTPR